MTGTALLLYVAAHAPAWLQFVFIDGGERVGLTARSVSCAPGRALIVWSGGTFQQAIDLLQHAGSCLGGGL